MRKIYLQFITLFVTTLMWSQQDVQYTQYMYNMSIINPAYTTGTTGVFNMGGLYRTQWVGVVGAPQSANLFVHTSLNDNVEVGLSYVNDNIGDIVKENNLFADFAYKLDFDNQRNLSFGLKAGASFFNVDFSSLNLESGGASTDPNFENNVSQTFFNFGAGIYYNTANYYVGLSIPNFIKSKHLDLDNGKYQGVEEAHFYLTGGYVFELNPQFKFKPAFLAKAATGAPIALDLTANVLYENRLEFGLGYRLNDAVMGLVNFGITPELRIGYAYDYTISNLSDFSSGSHEFLILYNLDSFGINKGFDKSPRFF